MTTTPVLPAQHTHMTHTPMTNTQTAMTIIIPQKAGALLRLLHQILLLVKRGLWLCAEDTVIHRHPGQGGLRLLGNISSIKMTTFSDLQCYLVHKAVCNCMQIKFLKISKIIFWYYVYYMYMMISEH